MNWKYGWSKWFSKDRKFDDNVSGLPLGQTAIKDLVLNLTVHSLGTFKMKLKRDLSKQRWWKLLFFNYVCCTKAMHYKLSVFQNIRLIFYCRYFNRYQQNFLTFILMKQSVESIKNQFLKLWTLIYLNHKSSKGTVVWSGIAIFVWRVTRNYVTVLRRNCYIYSFLHLLWSRHPHSVKVILKGGPRPWINFLC